MSLNALSSAASTALSTVSFHPHGHRKGARPDASSTASTSSGSSISGSTSGITIGQLPVGASTPLFNNILQSLQQTVSAAAAVSGAAAPAATTAGTTGTAAVTGSPAAGATAATGGSTNVQAFMHTLFQALKQDGLGAGNSAVAASASPSSAPAATNGQYQANLVSSLQTLIGQVGSASAANPSMAGLKSAFQNLVSATGAGAATTSAASAGASSAQSSGAGLQTFLNNLLQNLQSGGVHSLSGIGNNVNANV